MTTAYCLFESSGSNNNNNSESRSGSCSNTIINDKHSNPTIDSHSLMLPRLDSYSIESILEKTILKPSFDADFLKSFCQIDSILVLFLPKN
jgi:hypothetical protein